MGESKSSRNQSGWALEVAAFVLWIGVFIGGPGAALIFGAFTIIDLTGGGDNSSTTVSAQLAPPFEIEMDNGTQLVVASDGTSNLVAADGELLHSSFSDTTIDTMVPLADGHFNGVLSTLAIAPVFLAVWVGLYQLWRVIQSARDGDPFTQRNISRLRWVAGCVAAIPVAGTLASLAARQLIIDQVDASVVSPDWTLCLATAVGILALAEVFRRGVDLRLLTERTI